MKRNADIQPLKVLAGMNVLVETDHDFVSREIVRAQRREGFSEEDSQWTHVETCLGCWKSVGAVWPESRVNDIRGWGARRLKFIYLKAEAFRTTPGLPLLPLSAHVAMWAASRCNLPYGLPALLWWNIRHEFWNRYAGADRRTWRNWLASDRSPFCSQLCAWALRKEGFDPFPGVSDGAVMPAHFAAASGPDGPFEVVDVTA